MTHNFDDQPDLNEALADYLEAAEGGTPLDREEWLARYPALADELLAFLDDLQVIDQAVTPLRQAAEAGGGAGAIDRAWDIPVRSKQGDEQPAKTHAAQPPQRRQKDATIDEANPELRPDRPASLPKRIAHFRIEQLLGKGGCGIVYLAWDEKLNRLVAIKVPHADLVARPGAADAYLREARTVASLEHPNIVPVYQADSSAEFPCYIVSKYIDGSDLASLMAQALLPLGEIIRLTAIVAETLHYAHGEGVVHRDIKPGNILLDAKGTPFVTDFGLALREQDVGKGPRYLGTPVYMSPEQARGEGHRVDGRSDVFSLGVVLYELLTGRRPFHGTSEDELLEQIVSREVRPPRQWDDTLPPELERICLKALAKRASDRYTTAKDFADDLRQFLASAPSDPRLIAVVRERNEAAAVTPVPSPAPTPVDTRPLKVVPRGLRSFDASDADFFLELLPGPRDRDGLPESIRFWKSAIEAADAEKTFSVGLIYGPSGSGKSSLMKAGLLPRLADHVIPLYIEATADDTEARVFSALRKRLPTCRGVSPRRPGTGMDSVPPLEEEGSEHRDAGRLGETPLQPHPLKDTLTALRRGEHLPEGKKVLLVLDQFEQWLHGWKSAENADLLQALRQCDGVRVQCLLMLRADFWVAVSTFLKALEIGDGSHVVLVDRFDLDHARKVLTAFGRALCKLPEGKKVSDPLNPRGQTPFFPPEHTGNLTKEQEQFLTQALDGLAEDNKVISVRLALFADMMKAKPWTPAVLTEMGGTEGVGVRFLEDTFSSPTANPLHRRHEKAARAVLQALLPDAATDIKGHLRPASELLAASGYANRPKDFDDLLHILDRELHLITPADAEANGAGEPGGVSPRSSDRFYQLTHDYLVPDLRAWLTQKQKETRRGRAELLLADRAAVWNARPVNRQLPSLPEWLRISFLTARKAWTAPQRKMMRRATRYHVTRWLTIVVAITGLVWGSYEVHGRLQARALYARLMDAEREKVPAVLAEMAPYRRWLNPLLQANFPPLTRSLENNPDAARKRRRVAVALVGVDMRAFNELFSYVLNGDPQETALIGDALTPRQKELQGRVKGLWSDLTQTSKAKPKRLLGAAALLAHCDAKNSTWEEAAPLVARTLVLESVVNPGAWVSSLEPIREKLRAPLTAIYRDDKRDVTERAQAKQLLIGFFGDWHDVVADIFMDGDPSQFRSMFVKVQGSKDKVLPALKATLALPSPAAKTEAEKERLAKRQANAAVAMLKLDQPELTWPLLASTADPRARTYLIHRLAPCRADPRAILEQLDRQKDISIRRGLVLALGELQGDQLAAGPGPEQLRPGDKEKLIALLYRLYHEDPDPGMHGAVDWLTRKWGGGNRLKEEDAQLIKQRPDILKKITQALARPSKERRPQWYINGQGLTMVAIPEPGEVQLGWPSARERDASMAPTHKSQLGYSFAMATTSVTVEQFQRFCITHKLPIRINTEYARWTDCPVHGVSWYLAAQYCNWLTRQEELGEDQCCYLPNEQGKYDDGMRLAPDYLKRRGYRLPTEDEWEYACRAGAATSRYYGESDELLDKYACFQKNSGAPNWPKGRTKPGTAFDDQSWPVGSFMPNDLGLFDMHGNVWNWCQDGPRRRTADNDANEGTVHDGDRRWLRGGSFRSPAGLLHCSRRTERVPTDTAVNVGFRVVRTFVSQ